MYVLLFEEFSPHFFHGRFAANTSIILYCYYLFCLALYALRSVTGEQTRIRRLFTYLFSSLSGKQPCDYIIENVLNRLAVSRMYSSIHDACVTCCYYTSLLLY